MICRMSNMMEPVLSAGNSMVLGFMGIPPTLLLLIGATMLVSFLAQFQLKRRFAQHSREPIPATGKQVAEQMLKECGIDDVQVISVPGQLTDHYNPINKTVNLSEVVYHMNNVAAAAVAAHECGHAVQHAKAYRWLTMRSKLVPVTQFASKTMNIVMWISILGVFALQTPIFLWVYVACLAMTTLFAFITLPVEFDASKRAMAWLRTSGMSGTMKQDKAENALFWAAMTYVVAALSSLAMLIYYLSIILGRRN